MSFPWLHLTFIITMLALNIFFLNLVLVLGDGTPCTKPNPSSDSFRVRVKVSSRLLPLMAELALTMSVRWKDWQTG